MRCIKCGYENIEGLKYCSSCGEELLTQEQMVRRNKQNKSKAERFQFFVNQTKTYANYIINGKLEDKENKDRKLLSKKKMLTI